MEGTLEKKNNTGCKLVKVLFSWYRGSQKEKGMVRMIWKGNPSYTAHNIQHLFNLWHWVRRQNIEGVPHLEKSKYQYLCVLT